MNQKQKQILNRIENTGFYITQSENQAKIAKKTPGVTHVYSINGVHRFIGLKT